MCLTCGCMQTHLEMGQNNIRYEDVNAAADELRQVRGGDARHHRGHGGQGP